MTKHPLETLEQITLIGVLRKTYPLAFAIRNGGKRTPKAAEKAKREGELPGIPDLFIPEILTFVEMKRVKGGRLSTDQKTIIQAIKDTTQCRVIVAKGYQDALIQLGIKTIYAD